MLSLFHGLAQSVVLEFPIRELIKKNFSLQFEKGFGAANALKKLESTLHATEINNLRKNAKTIISKIF